MSLGRHAGKSDTGRKRRHNEDSFIVAPPMFAVADGMGGANAGEVASGLAVEALRERSGDGPSGDKLVTGLVQEANRRVFQKAESDSEHSGMGTTMTVALIENGIVRFGHVGDSRAYLYRDGELIQLTEDHSLVGELVRSGKISAKEAETHPQRSVITRALGTDPDVDVDTFTVETRSGDLFLLCSDGLYSMVGSERILELVEKYRGNLDQATEQLIAAANKKGGDDNITVVFFEIAAEGEETVRLPAAAAPTAEEEEPEEEEEEDTLDEAEGVPALSTMVLRPGQLQQAMEDAQAPAEEEPVDEEEAAIEEAMAQEGKSRRGPAVAALVVLAVVVTLVVLWLLDVIW